MTALSRSDNSFVVRKLAARVAVAFSVKSGRPVDPRVAVLANQPVVPGEGRSSRRNSLPVRQAAARVAVIASRKTGRTVDPRTRGLAS